MILAHLGGALRLDAGSGLGSRIFHEICTASEARSRVISDGICPDNVSQAKEYALIMCQIVNAKGEMKGSAITGPVGKEAAELWPVSTIPSIYGRMQG